MPSAFWLIARRPASSTSPRSKTPRQGFQWHLLGLRWLAECVDTLCSGPTRGMCCRPSRHLYADRQTTRLTALGHMVEPAFHTQSLESFRRHPETHKRSCRADFQQEKRSTSTNIVRADFLRYVMPSVQLLNHKYQLTSLVILA